MKDDNAIKPMNFIRQIIDKDLANGKYEQVCTRFPPEPNGYLHIGHAKAICLNFGIARDYQGTCHLRFDDTNPIKEELEYVEAIKQDVQWLDFYWDGAIHYSSDYFEAFWTYANELIQKRLAYVDELTPDQIREYRGTLTSPGKNSPYRERSVEDNILLFQKMREGAFSEGQACLRAKINMASDIIVMRDPVLYRVKFTEHHQTGNKWNIYPMYDFAHCISDALEGITHSLCTLEFQDNRRLYDWVLNNITLPSKTRPYQYEFSRLNLEYAIMSKRKLNILVNEKAVEGWDDPRMLTISGLRRRGYTPASIREFCQRIGVTKQDNRIEMSALESCIREDLNENAPRAMAVIDPLKISIENVPENHDEWLTVPVHPNKSEMGTRHIPFTREIYIDRADFREKANKDYKRLTLDKEIRLRNAYVIKVERVIKNNDDEIIELICTCDKETLGKAPKDGRKIKGVIHWVSKKYAKSAEFRLYSRLFSVTDPAASEDFLSTLNPDSLIIKQGFVELGVEKAKPGEAYQFEREGYFCVDSRYSKPNYLVFNRTVELRDGGSVKASANH